jgi:hypothetical protein
LFALVTVSALQEPWEENVYKPLDITRILRSPHKIPKGFKEWLPTFFGDDPTLAQQHLDTFASVFQCYDPYEDVWMKLFSLSSTGKAREWYVSITPGAITS